MDTVVCNGRRVWSCTREAPAAPAADSPHTQSWVVQSPYSHITPALYMYYHGHIQGMWNASPSASVWPKTSRPTDFFAFLEHSCAKLQANLTLQVCREVFSFQERFDPEPPLERGCAPGPFSGLRQYTPSSPQHTHIPIDYFWIRPAYYYSLTSISRLR